MKLNSFYIYLILFSLTHTACQDKKPYDSQNERFISLHENDVSKVPEWLVKGTKAYGLVIYTQEGKPRFGKPVLCEIKDISIRGVKCEALEKVSLFDELNCFKVGIQENEVWYDVPQDLFKSREEALAFLQTQHLLIEIR